MNERPKPVSRAAKVEWLRANPAAWAGHNSAGFHARGLFEKMQRAGLYGKNTDWQNANLFSLIALAKVKATR